MWCFEHVPSNSNRVEPLDSACSIMVGHQTHLGLAFRGAIQTPETHGRCMEFHAKISKPTYS